MNSTATRTLGAASLLAALVAACSHSGPPPGATAPATAQPPAAQHAMSHVPATIAEWAHGAQLFAGLGAFHRDIGSASAEAGKYFDQGMRLMWAFNHDESTRSFAQAAALDPACAICYWGVALTVGPNYNLPMMEDVRARVAWEALGKARANAAHALPVEQALIEALGRRYPAPKPLDPSNSGPVLLAYAQAMKTVAGKYPGDLDVQALYAEALMNLNPWKLWSADGRPAPRTEEIVATLAAVLARDPQHPGANHYYVHALEASPHPERAVAAAERLRGMMPAAGHLEHMPAHILQRVGRYEEAAEANRRGVAADTAYFGATQAPDYYLMYKAHNLQFLAYSTAMEGRKAETLQAVMDLRQSVPNELLLSMPGLDWYMSEEYAALLRFGLWEEMLALAAPDSRLQALTGGYLYGRGVALAATGRVAQANATLDDLKRLTAQLPADAAAGYNSAQDVLGIAAQIVAARIAVAEHRPEDALTRLRKAVADEDRLAYDEPRDWFFPVRHLLGAELLRSHRAAEAEAVFRDDLRYNPNNGWALYGLTAALRAQGKAAEAAQLEPQFRTAWQNADIELTAAAF